MELSKEAYEMEQVGHLIEGYVESVKRTLRIHTASSRRMKRCITTGRR